VKPELKTSFSSDMIFDICKKIEDAQGRSGGHSEPEPVVLSSAGLASFDSQEGT
jgi:hypothetical protein